MRPLDEHLRQVCEERAPAAGSACGLARRFLAPAPQDCVLALQALFASLRGVPADVSDPAVGLAKLAWWENELRGALSGPSRHPVVQALSRTGVLDRPDFRLPESYFACLAARLDAAPFPSFDELDGWLCATYGAEARLLDAPRAARSAGSGLDRAGAAAGLLELLESWAPGAERPAWVPLEFVARAGSGSGRDAGLRAGLVAELASAALRRLDAGRSGIGTVDEAGNGMRAGAFIAARHAVVRRRLAQLSRRPARSFRAGFAGLGDVFAAWSAARRHGAAGDALE